MDTKKKLVYISSIAAPHQIKLCNELKQYFDVEFWFYESALRTRGSLWCLELSANCKILPDVWFAKPGKMAGRYICLNLNKRLADYNPDIVMVGGFSIPANFFAYRWAKSNGKKTVVFTERSRNKDGILRQKTLFWRVLHFLYRDVDLVMTSAEDAVQQFKDFGFKDQVLASRYASDIDSYLQHQLRPVDRDSYTLLFPNRMTKIYNPLLVLEIFSVILLKYPHTKLLMNAAGEMAAECCAKIQELGLDNHVEFLTDIKSWNDLPLVYERSDVMILPALFSNGNFTILESMASGLGIVISNKILGIGKLINNEVNGFNCEPTVASFVAAIEKYFNQPELFSQHASLNREIVQPLSVAGTAKSYFTLLSSHLYRERN